MLIARKIHHSLNYISEGARSSIFAHSSLDDNTRLKHRTHGCCLQGTWYAYEINSAFQLRTHAQNFVTYWSRNHNYCRYYALIMAFIYERRSRALIYMVIFLNEMVKTPRSMRTVAGRWLARQRLCLVKRVVTRDTNELSTMCEWRHKALASVERTFTSLQCKVLMYWYQAIACQGMISIGPFGKRSSEVGRDYVRLTSK